MKKLTVKHYLNKKLKPDNDGSYPIYVRVIYNRQNTNFKSEIVRLVFANENQFENNKEIIRDREYECELISSIVNFGVDLIGDKFSITRIFNLISYWKDPLTDSFEDIFLKKKDLSDQLVKFFKGQLKIKQDSIKEIIGLPDLTIEVLHDLAINEVFTTDITKHIYYLSILNEFSINNYGDDPWRYGSDNTFNFYEWSDKNIMQKFKTFAYNSELLDNNTINEITENFNKELISMLKGIIEFNQDFYIAKSLRND